MHWAIYLFVGLLLTYIGFFIYMKIKSRAIIGKPSSPLLEALPELAKTPQPAVVYCYSNQCGPCKAMTPQMQELGTQTGRVLIWNLSDTPEVARQLGIHGTPTLLKIRDDKIEDSVLGVRSQKFVAGMLEG